MYCSHLLLLDDVLSRNQIIQLDEYFCKLLGAARNNIMASKIKQILMTDDETVYGVLVFCEKHEILVKRYAAVCPTCGGVIKALDNIEECRYIETCYMCDANIEVDNSNIIILYSINNKLFPFEERQQDDYDAVCKKAIVAEKQDIDTISGFNKIANQLERLNNQKEAVEEEKKHKDEVSQNALRDAYRIRKRNKRIKMTVVVISTAIIGFVAFYLEEKFGYMKSQAVVTICLALIPIGMDYVIEYVWSTDIDEISLNINNN